MTALSHFSERVSEGSATPEEIAFMSKVAELLDQCRSPINVTQNFGGHAALDLETIDEGLPDHLDDAVTTGD